MALSASALSGSGLRGLGVRGSEGEGWHASGGPTRPEGTHLWSEGLSSDSGLKGAVEKKMEGMQ